MVKDHSDSETGNSLLPFHGLMILIMDISMLEIILLHNKTVVTHMPLLRNVLILKLVNILQFIEIQFQLTNIVITSSMHTSQTTTICILQQNEIFVCI